MGRGDGGVGRSDSDVLGVGPCVPLRHHRPAKCGEYQRHRHRGGDDARRAEIRFIVTMPPPHQHRTVGSYRSAPVIMCFYWDRNAMVVTLFSLLDGTDYGPYNGHYYQNQSHYGANNSRQQLRIRREQRNHPIRRYVPENQRDHADNHA